MDLCSVHDKVHTGDVMSSAELSQHALCLCVSDLLDDGLNAHHHTGNVVGSHLGLEVDDPALRRSQCPPHLPLQGETSSSPVCPHLSSPVCLCSPVFLYFSLFPSRLVTACRQETLLLPLKLCRRLPKWTELLFLQDDWWSRLWYFHFDLDESRNHEKLHSLNPLSRVCFFYCTSRENLVFRLISFFSLCCVLLLLFSCLTGKFSMWCLF